MQEEGKAVSKRKKVSDEIDERITKKPRVDETHTFAEPETIGVIDTAISVGKFERFGAVWTEERVVTLGSVASASSGEKGKGRVVEETQEQIKIYRRYLGSSKQSWIDFGLLPRRLRIPSEKHEQFKELWNAQPEEWGTVKMMGKIISLPRKQQSYLVGYYFTGLMHDAIQQLPTKRVEELFNFAKSLGYGVGGGNFNGALLNWYRDGRDYIGPHADDIRQLDPKSAVFSASFGTERTFRIRKIERGKPAGPVVLDIALIPNCFVVMGGAMQSTHKHEVPKISGKRGLSIGKRINVTFRQFKQQQK